MNLHVHLFVNLKAKGFALHVHLLPKSMFPAQNMKINAQYLIKCITIILFFLTKSKADPPPRYSIMIHNFVP